MQVFLPCIGAIAELRPKPHRRPFVGEHTGISQFHERQLQSISGVSLDEELADLILYQQAYSAAARVPHRGFSTRCAHQPQA